MIEAEAPMEVVAPSAGGVVALLRSGAVVSAGVGGTYALNTLFSYLMVKELAPRQYSLMAALFAVVLLSNVPTLALQTGVARGMAVRLEAGGEAAAGAVLRRALRTVLRWQAVVLVVAALTAYP